jgi:hypothetical protein
MCVHGVVLEFAASKMVTKNCLLYPMRIVIMEVSVEQKNVYIIHRGASIAAAVDEGSNGISMASACAVACFSDEH